MDNIVSTGSTFISADAYQIVASVKVAGGGYRHITITVEQRDGGRYGREYEHLEGMKDCYPGDDAHMTHLSSIQQAATDVCMIAGLEKERIKQVVIEGKSASESRCDGTRPADSA